MCRLWAEHDLLVEHTAEQQRAHAIALFQAASGVLGRKEGVQRFNKWLDDLG